MKKSIFKALAATAVVGTVIALSGVVASAADYGTLPAGTTKLADATGGPFSGKDADGNAVEEAVLPGITAYSSGTSGFDLKTGNKTGADGESYTQWIQVGKGNKTYTDYTATTIDVSGLEKYLGIYTSGAGTLTIEHNAGSSNVDGSTAFFADSTGNVQSFITDNTKTGEATVNIAAAGKYYLFVPGNTTSLNVFALKFTASGEEPTEPTTTPEPEPGTDPQPEGTTESPIELATASTNDKTYVFVGVDKASAEGIGSISINEDTKNVGDKDVTVVYNSVVGVATPDALADKYVFAYEVAAFTGSHTIVAKADTGTESKPITLTGAPETSSAPDSIGPGAHFDIAGTATQTELKDKFQAAGKGNKFDYGPFSILADDIDKGHIRLADGSYITFKADDNCKAVISVENHDAKITAVEPAGTTTTLTVNQTTSVDLTKETVYTIEENVSGNHTNITDITFE